LSAASATGANRAPGRWARGRRRVASSTRNPHDTARPRTGPPPRGQRPSEVLPDPQGGLPEGPRPCTGGRRRELLARPERDAGAGRRERVRQDDDIALHPQGPLPHPGPDPFPHRGGSRGGRCPDAEEPAPAAPAPDADDLPGSVLLAEPPEDAPRYRGGAAPGQRHAEPA